MVLLLNGEDKVSQETIMRSNLVFKLTDEGWICLKDRSSDWAKKGILSLKDVMDRISNPYEPNYGLG
jgi:hypothetical protein